MNWTEEKLEELPIKDGFRLRGLETTRLDTFIDAAFAFATTMLIISLGDIPNNFDELIIALKGTQAFAMSFAAFRFKREVKKLLNPPSLIRLLKFNYFCGVKT